MRQALILLLMVSSSAHAQSPAVAPTSVDDANHIVRDIGHPEPPCSACAAIRTEDERPAWKRCTAELCPGGLTTTMKGFYEFVGKNVLKLLDVPNLKSAISAAVKSQKAKDELALRSLRKNKAIADVNIKAFYRGFRGYDDIGNLVVNAQGTVDQKASIDKFIGAGLTTSDFKNAMVAYDALIKVNKRAPDLFLKSLDDLTPAEAKEKSILAIRQIEQMESAWGSKLHLPPQFVAGRDQEALKRKIELGQITPAVIDKLNEKWGSSDFINLILKNAGSEAGEDLEPRKLFTPDAEEKLSERIKAADEFLAGRESSLKPLMSSIEAKCLNAYILGQGLTPNSDQIQHFRKAEKKIRSQFINRARPFLSRHSWSLLEKASKQWQFTSIKTKEQFISEFDERLTNSSNEDLTNEQDIKGADEQEENVLTVVTATEAGKSAEDLDTYKDLSKICTEQVPQVMKDFANVGGKAEHQLHFSEYTVIDEDTRVSRMFHEYSHLISKVISESPNISKETLAWYKDLRNCLNRQHGEDAKFEEEDWADLFAAATSPESPGIQCVSDWSNDEMEKYISLKPDDSDKEHSGNFYLMLMQFRVRHGSIPQSCRQALLAKGESRMPENCLEQAASVGDRVRAAR